MTRITGRSAFLALLKDEGVTHLFGNPGTTELPIMHALKDHPEITFIMAMQESLVVAMADGFSRASGRLVGCSVHVAPGLGNSLQPPHLGLAAFDHPFPRIRWFKRITPQARDTARTASFLPNRPDSRPYGGGIS
jgi:hypothetical protein